MNLTTLQRGQLYHILILFVVQNRTLWAWRLENGAKRVTRPGLDRDVGGGRVGPGALPDRRGRERGGRGVEPVRDGADDLRERGHVRGPGARQEAVGDHGDGPTITVGAKSASQNPQFVSLPDWVTE